MTNTRLIVFGIDDPTESHALHGAKYLLGATGDGESLMVVFGPQYSHQSLAGCHGLVAMISTTMGPDDDPVCYGESTTLGRRSRGDADTAILQAGLVELLN